MLKIKNVTTRAFLVALRWAKFKHYPNLVSDWTQEQSDKVQAVADECDRREQIGWDKYKLDLEKSFER